MQQQQAVTQQELIGLLNSHLYQLGWTWQHPRIKSYLDKVANRLLVFQFQSLEDIPIDYLSRLNTLVEMYYHCDRLLKMMKKPWTDKDIQEIIVSYGYEDKMPLKGWERLRSHIDDVWYNTYGF
jgi:hypothetical protein